MERQIRYIGFMLISQLLLCQISFGQEAKTEFSVSAPEEAVTGQAFQVVFELNRVADHFEGPEIKGLEILGGPGYSESRQVAMINGKQTATVKVTYTYAMKALVSGTAEIGSAYVRIGRKTYRTKPVSIAVTGKPPVHEGEWADPGKSGGDIFIANLITNKSPYKGEVIVLTQKLYTRLSVNNIGSVKMPAFHGFWYENIEIGNYEVVQENYQGKLYNTLVLSRTVLVPQRTGKVVIEPSTVMIQRVVERTVDRPLWGGVIQQRVRELVDNEIKSSSITLDIRELPTPGRPDNYTGSVGNFAMEADLSTDKAVVGEPVELRIRISGKGNIKLLDEPIINFPPGLEMFDPEITGKVNVNTAGMSGAREYTYLIIPRDTGKFVIPGIEFSYFDPSSKKYINRISGVMRLSVSPAGKGDIFGTPGTDKTNVEYFGKDIRFLSPDYSNPPVARLKPGSIEHLLTIAIPLLILFVILTIYRKQVRLRADTRRLRFSRALTQARARMREAQKAKGSNNRKLFFEIILDALWGYASDKLFLHPSELSRGRLREALTAGGVPDELVQKMLGLI
ncbi:MAG: BatD family protein [Bacteroidales bacterium]